MDEQQQRYLQVFIEEAENHLEEATEILTAQAPLGPEAIATLFRLFHTLKSMAASMQQQALADLFHALEDRLNEAQHKGTLAERDRRLGSLLAGTSTPWEEAVAAISNDGPWWSICSRTSPIRTKRLSRCACSSTRAPRCVVHGLFWHCVPYRRPRSPPSEKILPVPSWRT
ncbi:MAG: Hpt domain-containing protein [Firmicutes bacterium]|nr:Hpt domain-containing protein [Bacillota bacterium]